MPRLNRAVLLASALAASLPLAASAQPASTEKIAIPGLQQRAEILIDRWGVPHIYAASERDAFFMQGFNAARDRLFQIDLWRRRGLGQLSEVFGPAYLPQDRATRLFLYRGDMRREWAAYGPGAESVAHHLDMMIIWGAHNNGIDIWRVEQVLIHFMHGDCAGVDSEAAQTRDCALA